MASHSGYERRPRTAATHGGRKRRTRTADNGNRAWRRMSALGGAGPSFREAHALYHSCYVCKKWGPDMGREPEKILAPHFFKFWYLDGYFPEDLPSMCHHFSPGAPEKLYRKKNESGPLARTNARIFSNVRRIFGRSWQRFFYDPIG